jgi:hypothetical protein
MSIVLFGLIASACNHTSENNHGLDYESLDIAFSAKCGGSGWSTDDVVGVYATCTRNENENTSMGEKGMSCFKPLQSGESANLVSVGVNDKLISYANDHNFRFYAFMPYDDASSADLTQLSANIPANVTFGEKVEGLYVATNTVTSVVAPVALTFKSTSCYVTLQVPADIISDEGTTLRKMTITSSTQNIAYDATYNLYTGKSNIVSGTNSKQITVDFGESGYLLPTGYTAVNLLMAPFTVEEGGFDVEFTDVNGDTNTVPLLAKEAGTKYTAGSVIEATMTPSSDGIVPCSSPVEWPIGYVDGVGVFTNTTQPLWHPTKTYPGADVEHIWTSSQSQATITFVTSDENPGTPTFETGNFSQYNYSSPCVKGIWTGDYFLFDVPVRKFKAGTEVTLTLPTYGRGNPLFWDVEYLDGEEWKCNRETHTSPDGKYVRESTLMIEHGNRDGSFEGIRYTTKMVFENAIASGHLYIRFKVATGQFITVDSSTYSTTCKELSAPDSSNGQRLFAFVNKSGVCTSIKIEW